MANVSEHWPGVLFIIECKGETADDLSRVYAKDGMYQVVRSQVTCPEHDPEQMKRPWSKNFTPETPVDNSRIPCTHILTAALIAYISRASCCLKRRPIQREVPRKTTAKGPEFLY